MRMRREYVRLLQNEGCAKLKPYSVRLQNKKGAWLPFLMRWMLTRVSEAGWTGGTQGQKQSKCNQAKVANAQPKEEPDVSPQVLKQAAALMTAGVLNIPHRASCYRREEWRFAVVSPTHPQLWGGSPQTFPSLAKSDKELARQLNWGGFEQHMGPFC